MILKQSAYISNEDLLIQPTVHITKIAPVGTGAVAARAESTSTHEARGSGGGAGRGSAIASHEAVSCLSFGSFVGCYIVG